MTEDDRSGTFKGPRKLCFSWPSKQRHLENTLKVKGNEKGQIFGTISQSWKLRWSESMIHSPTHKVTWFPNQLPVLVYHYQYLLIVVVSIPQDLQIARFVLIPSMNFRQMWVRPVIVLFWTPAVDEMASKTFSWVEVECASSRDAHCSHLTSRRLSNWKVTVPSSSLQVTSKLKSWPVHVLGSSVGQMEQSNWCRLTTAGWHSPQPQHLFCRSEWDKRSRVNFLDFAFWTWVILFGWLIHGIRSCKDPKAHFKDISESWREAGLVVSFVHCFSEVSQRESAGWDTVNLCHYFGIFRPATLVCVFVSSTEMEMAGKAAGLKSIWVVEQPPAASRGVSRSLQWGRLTLTEKLNWAMACPLMAWGHQC